jgi:hypothetical protein
VKELAKTCTQIANILDRAEITLRLYSSERLMGAVSELYVNILEFLKHAVKWYAKGRLGRAWTAIARPWELGFRDYVLEIKAVSKRIEGVAEVASQAELRATRLETKQVREELALTKLQLERLLPMMERKSIMPYVFPSISDEAQKYTLCRTSCRLTTHRQWVQYKGWSIIRYYPCPLWRICPPQAKP